MSYKLPFLEEVKVTTLLKHKKDYAPNGYIFFIATLKYANMVYTIRQLVNRKGSTTENETTFIDAMKRKLLSDVLTKNKLT